MYQHETCERDEVCVLSENDDDDANDDVSKIAEMSHHRYDTHEHNYWAIFMLGTNYLNERHYAFRGHTLLQKKVNNDCI